jgi:hypothetical protein
MGFSGFNDNRISNGYLDDCVTKIECNLEKLSGFHERYPIENAQNIHLQKSLTSQGDLCKYE